jgi:purine-binding chemotaxis protein CheW
MNVNELIRNQSGIQTRIEDAVQNRSEEHGFGDGARIIQLVSFMLEDVEYGVDILSVHEILRIPEMTRLPNTPEFIKGVINLRGNVIPVVDVRKRFGFASAEDTEQTRIIVVEAGDRQFGMLVDVVSQVIRISENNIDPPSVLIEGVSEEFIKGVGRLRDRLVIILSLDNLLFTDEDNERVVAKKFGF